jgi:hypothetical protein
MKLAHLILAHNNPAQLERLVRRLAGMDTDIFIQLDGKTDLHPFEYLTKIDHVYFIENRVPVYWGTFSIVQATLNGFEEILDKDKGQRYSHINLLSAQDYPLRSPAQFKQFLAEHPDRTFIHALNIREDWTEAMDRVKKFNFGDYRFPGHYLLQYAANILFLRKKVPEQLVPHGRSQWFTITPECARYVINYVNTHANVKRYFRMSFAPDEFFFQTILMNSPLKDKVVNDNLRYIDFSLGGTHPKVLTVKDANQMISSEKYFARKFNQDTDGIVLNYLDWLIDAQPEHDLVQYKRIRQIFSVK